MKKLLLITTLLALATCARALDWTYSTNLYYALSYPTNIYMGTNGTDAATNGDSFYQWGTKLNGFMLLSERNKATQAATNAWLSLRIGTNETKLAGGLTTNLPVLFGNGTTNTLYFTNGVLKRVN